MVTTEHRQCKRFVQDHGKQTVFEHTAVPVQTIHTTVKQDNKPMIIVPISLQAKPQIQHAFAHQ